MKALGELSERDWGDLCVCWLKKGVELGELAKLYKKKIILKVDNIPPQMVLISGARPRLANFKHIKLLIQYIIV